MTIGSETTASGIRISIDRGGTFTDCIAQVPGQSDVLIKLLSVDPNNYQDAPTEAIRRVLERATGKSYPKGDKISLKGVESIKMGTTVATNALLERKGEKTLFVVTEGLKDLLHIGDQSRPRMFDLAINKPSVLYSKVVEIRERVTLEAWTERTALREIDVDSDAALLKGVTGEIVRIVKPLDLAEARRTLQAAFDEGYRSVAVCLMHSYTFPDHEISVGKLADEIGFTNVSLSSQLAPIVKIVPRGNSATADAYLTPEIKKYLDGFERGFEDLRTSGCRCEFMQSDGGLVEFSRLSGLRSILSGPAGGVVGYARTSFDPEEDTPIIGFDMGGTSTDVSRYAGELEQVFETATAGVIIQSPQLDINTVAAGGGSVLSWSSGLLKVGPESAGAHPGPACYRKGGPLTITDANLVLGRLRPDSFPSIFGPNEDQPLDLNASQKLFSEITIQINRETNMNMSIEEVAAGFVDVANETMCRPIRILTEARGYDASKHHLSSFGGAGGQHACEIAKKLGIRRINIHKYSSILSAYGMALADMIHEERSPAALVYANARAGEISGQFANLEEKTISALENQGIHRSRITSERYLNLRYHGSDTPLMIPQPADGDFLRTFREAHRQQFGFLPVGRHIIVDDYRVRSIGHSKIDMPASPYTQLKTLQRLPLELDVARPQTNGSVYFSETGWTDTPVYNLDVLQNGLKVSGPALIINDTQTLVVVPGAAVTILSNSLVIDILTGEKHNVSETTVDPIQASIFAHRFMGVAEQMGRALQKTSVSTNIKERLDFSCTVFSPDGGLVANAPHVPAMIGSMAFAVKWQISHWGGRLQPGDVLLSNSPICGGTHLPDLTVITPVFDEAGDNIIFWTASRGHHADIGGILPGSMPPNSKALWEEGAVIESFKVIEGGEFQEEQLIALLMAPAAIDGCSGSRCLRDNISDIKAQAAANRRGAQLIHSLIRDYSLPIVLLYMEEIQRAAELAVRNMLKTIHTRVNGRVLTAVDYMDDGTPIQLQVTIDPITGSAIFDFEGTGPEAYGNWNAPIAICHSSIIFALRCMVNVDMPLNQGAIRPIDVRIPENSLLRPSPTAACCAGNVLTSQRIVDVIFRAFSAVAASQGCMNNLTFGIEESESVDDSFGYYETICGGSGAGPSWHGISGVHTNMTNTRITDPEVLERRYPVILRRFCLREGSGGRGRYNGGDGIIRDIEFSIPMSVSILSERRAFQPYGLEGGEGGQRGRNLWLKKNGQVINLGGKNTVRVSDGDRVVVESPGGGAFGSEHGSSELVNGLCPLLNGAGEGRFKKFIGAGNGSVEILRSMGESA